MSAFFISTISINDAEKFQTYAVKSGATLAAFGGEVVIKGKFSHLLAGNENSHDAASVLKFPSMDNLNRWYESAEYQALIPLRDEAANVRFVAYHA